MSGDSKHTSDLSICDFVQEEYRNAVILSTKDQIDLIKKYRRARGRNRKAYKDQLVSTLWRYAIKEADKFKHIIDEQTARQAAYTGLITTLDKYKIDSGSALTTCMYWWVKLELIRTIYKVKYQIHLPEYLYSKIRKLIKNKCSYEDITRMTASDLANILFGGNPSHGQLRKMEVFMQTGLSIDTNEDNCGIKDNIPAYEKDGYELAEIRLDVRRALTRALRTQKIDSKTNKPVFKFYKFKLPNRKPFIIKIPENIIDIRDYDIICMYYGLNGDRCGLEELGKKYHITKEGIRQIRDRVQERLAPLLEGYDTAV